MGFHSEKTHRIWLYHYGTLTWWTMNLVILSVSRLLGLFRIISSMSPFIFSITT